MFFSCLLSVPPRDFSPFLGSSRLTGFFATSRVSRFVIGCVPEVCLVRRRHRATNSRPGPKCACAGASFSRVCVSVSAVNYFVFILFFFCKIGVRPAIPFRRSGRRSQSRVEPWVFPLVPLDQNSRARFTSRFFFLIQSAPKIKRNPPHHQSPRRNNVHNTLRIFILFFHIQTYTDLVALT